MHFERQFGFRFTFIGSRRADDVIVELEDPLEPLDRLGPACGALKELLVQLLLLPDPLPPTTPGMEFLCFPSAMGQSSLC